MTSEPEPDAKSFETAAASAGYRVLARKYRPRSFDDLIGQEPMVRTLTNAFDSGRIAQAWMLTGVRGVGKTTTARILARALNYETETIHQPTIHMPAPGIHCQAIMEGRHVDVVEMDAASHTGIDDVREIIAQVRYRPVSARYKVYIIDEVHMLSNQAFNGLLKTLEEPPEHAKFVFATTEIRKVPITVLSRCQRFDLRRVDTATLIAHLAKIAAAEKVEIEEEALRLIARAAEGSVRDSQSLLDQAISHGAGLVEGRAVRDMLGLADRVRIIDLFEHLMRGDASTALAELRDQHLAGADPVVVLSDLADFTHLVTSLRFVPDAAGDPSLSPAEIDRGLALAKSLSVKTLAQVWQMLLRAIEEARNAASPRQAAEMALIRIAYAADLPSPEDTIRLIRDGSPLPELPSPPAGGSNGSGEGAGATRTTAPSLGRPAAVQSPTLQPGSAARGAARGESSAQRQPLMGVAVPEGMAAPGPAPADPAPQGDFRSLADIVALAEEKRDSLMRISIHRYLRPVRVENGRLEVSLTEEAPRTLLGDLARKLHDWTGRRWIVSVSGTPGGQTLEEIETAKRDALVSDAVADPEVAKIMQAFPGSKVTEVRLRGEPEPEIAPPDDLRGIAEEDYQPDEIDAEDGDDDF